MGHDSYTEENNVDNEGIYSGIGVDKNDPESLKVEDYSKIIEELQSHRKEIEKLQLDMNGSVRDNSSTAALNNSSKSQITGNEFFPFCPLEELQHQLEEIIDEEVSGKEDYLTAEECNTAADQGFGLIVIFSNNLPPVLVSTSFNSSGFSSSSFLSTPLRVD